MGFVRRFSKFFLAASFFAYPLVFPLSTASESSLPVPIIHRDLIKHVREGISTNWSGYASLTSLTNPQRNSVSFVSGDWTVPTLTCGSQTTYSSVWVGIDGYASSTVEQIGTEHDCYQGQAYYYVWYEMYPRSMRTVSLTIKPGDQIHTEVSYLSNSNFRLTLKNGTTGGTFTTTQRANNTRRSSAEWVVEAPSSWSGVLPLSNFGTVTINKASATINGVTGPINNWPNDPITMVTNNLIAKAIPSALDTTGRSFSVTWNHN